MIIDEDEYLQHYGIIRRSGRYPWGSGGNAHGFLNDYKELRKKYSEAQAAELMGMTTKEVRARATIARYEIKQEQVHRAAYLRNEKQMSLDKVAETMGLPGDSSVRALLKPTALDKANKHEGIVNMLREALAEKTLIDMGEGVNQQLGISREQLDTAITDLEARGEARLIPVELPQLTNPNQKTKRRVLAPHDYDKVQVFRERENIQQLMTHSSDHGLTFDVWKEPLSISPKRVDIRYGPEGGEEADGVIFVRPGVKDLSMGANNYAQVRIKVGDKHYLKGMAVYKDDLPDGVDLVFNTNKDRTPNKLDAMKSIKEDLPDLPFGAVVRQILDKPGHPDAKVISAMNIVNDEEDWAKWSKTISAQMLSKQNPKLIKEQLSVTKERRLSDFQEIMQLTNPTVKKKLLEEFAEETDNASVHLKAAQLERSSWHVILPISSMKPTEIYAPNYKNGERVALIRYPHGGPFEIPELTVNNNQREARKLIGTKASTAVGIHHTVAKRLSGADFDGDTVLVIPNSNRANKIKTAPALPGLENFDPTKEYPKYPGMKVMKDTQGQMGKISNLITDMTLKGATNEELARAVKHSMVVIDAEKHELNYKLSEQENGIRSLKQKYQEGTQGRASTIVSKARSTVRREKYKPRPFAEGGPIDKVTGERVYVPANEFRKTKTGEIVKKQEKVPLLRITKDAHELSSGSIPEKMYADYSNELKALANKARLEALNTKPAKKNSQAAKVYATEVASLKAKRLEYDRNKPKERAAQDMGNMLANAKIRENPNMDDKVKRKVRSQALRTARARAGVERIDIEFTDREWEAIQANAISDHELKQLLKRTNTEQVRELATPRSKVMMTPNRVALAKSMQANDYTLGEISEMLGVSMSTLKRSL